MNHVDHDIISALHPDAVAQADHVSLQGYKRAIEASILDARTDKSRLDRERLRVREDLGPIAFDGDPTTATVLLLKANPSYGDDATRETHFQPHPDWPLSVAGPHVTPGTRAYYQNAVFGALRRDGVPLEKISRRMLKLELFPWASKKWPTGREALLKQMTLFPSRAPTLALVSQLIDQGALVLIARAEEEWFAGVPGLRGLLGTRAFVSRAKIAPAVSDAMYPGSWPLLRQALLS